MAQASEPVKIGLITTLSTPAGYIGEDIRDGFNLAIEKNGGKLGDVAVALEVEDDALKPANGKQIADKMLANNVKLFTGVNFSNVLTAVLPSVLKGDGFYVSNNPGLVWRILYENQELAKIIFQRYSKKSQPTMRVTAHPLENLQRILPRSSVLSDPDSYPCE